MDYKYIVLVPNPTHAKSLLLPPPRPFIDITCSVMYPVTLFEIKLFFLCLFCSKELAAQLVGYSTLNIVFLCNLQGSHYALLNHDYSTI